MTGFGRVSRQWQGKTLTVEIRSLNSKNSDVKMRLPQRYREREMDLRRLVLSKAKRGKLELNLNVDGEGAGGYQINKPLFRSYFKDLSALQSELGFDSSSAVSAILQIQGVVDVPSDPLPEEEWEALGGAVEEALSRLHDFRREEGAAMEADLRQRIRHISEHLSAITPFEEGRVERVRQRLLQNLSELSKDAENLDRGRLEQELIFYLEKYDLNEEKVRLRQHCQYFLEQLDDDKMQKGRKLAFISQEMGREINTIGAKANASEIQRLVVMMKDELEKIKEQTSNVL